MPPTDIKNPDYFHKVVDCQWACPAHTPVPEYIRLIAAGRYEDAERKLQEARDLDPTYPAVYSNFGYLYDAWREHVKDVATTDQIIALRTKALDAYGQLLTLSPDDAYGREHIKPLFYEGYFPRAVREPYLAFSSVGFVNDVVRVGDLTRRLAYTNSVLFHEDTKRGGAQPKAVEIARGVGIFAEVDASRIETRHSQGWVSRVTADLDEAFRWAEKAMAEKEPLSIAYHGNIVDLLEYAVNQGRKVDLLSDQTSCHAPYEGGYCPQGLTFEERTEMLAKDREEYRRRVDESLRKHFSLIKTLVERGTYFFDYGNSFMKAVFDAGVKEIAKNGRDELDGFIFPSYVEDIMGPMLFDYGYGPFRWVCLSGRHEDLVKTDRAAMECIDPNRRGQDRDNWIWIRDAEKNALVVGTQARILYQDAEGRMRIARRFNEMVRRGEIGPVMMGRDHHDVSGTDSPFRETANIKDGSAIMADMATHCFAGNAARGMSLVALHNGGGVGIGKAINGGFGLVLDGSEKADRAIELSLAWDVMGGVARRAWARNENALATSMEYNRQHPGTDHITLPFIADEDLVRETVKKALDGTLGKDA